MSKILVVGDTHGDIQNFINISTNYTELTKEDYVIVCGDFGFVWKKEKSYLEDYWLDWIDNLPWTTLFVLGNHENHMRIKSYPIKEWHGGRVREIRKSVYCLMTGEIFDLNGEKFFCFGGAKSVDRFYRVAFETWWPQEEANEEEYKNAVRNLEKINYKPDYIITHDMPFSYITDFYGSRAEGSKTAYMLNDFLTQCYGYKKWYCGHHHIDVAIRPEFQVCYKEIYEVM